MGLSSSKTKNDPWAPAQPYILKNLQQQDNVFQSTQPQLEKFAGMQRDSYGRLAPGAEQGIMGAQSLVNDNLSGKNLNGNPYIEGLLNKTRHNVTDTVNGQFEGAGRYGSGMHAGILGRELSDAENQLRFQNYGIERGYQQDAVGQAQGLMGGAQGLLNNAAELPWIGVQAANGAVRQASNGYGTTTQSTPWGPVLANAASNVAAAFAGGGSKGSDPALKENVVHIGTLPDGLNLYEFDYKPAPNEQIAAYMPEGRQTGVMADEVATLRPWALGPKIGGFATVNYGVL